MGRRSSRRPTRRAQRGGWWRHATTLAVLAWVSAILTVAPPIYSSLTWLETQREDYVLNRTLDRIIADARRREALARADAEGWGQLQQDTSTGIATGEAWLAAHPAGSSR